MPLKVKITAGMIIEAGFKIVKQFGWEAVNSRSVAKSLNCSTQPIYSAFKNMEQLKFEIIKMTTEVYDSYIKNFSLIRTDKKYKQLGLAYIMFAKEEPNLFKLLFMRNRQHEIVPEKLQDNNIDLILNLVSNQLNITKENAYNIHLNMWIFTHGIASMIATNFVNFSNEQIDELLTNQFSFIKSSFKKGDN